jgi:RHS repeat-associated protein
MLVTGRWDGWTSINAKVLSAKTIPVDAGALSSSPEKGKRYFGSSLGRFMTPDPLLNSGQPWNPQSWNRYAYVENNPLRYTDPTGLYRFGNCSGTKEQCKADQQRYTEPVFWLPSAILREKNLRQGILVEREKLCAAELLES